MTTKVRIDGVTIEATGDLETVLIARVFEYLAAKQTDIQEAASDALAGVKAATRDIDKAIEKFARQPAQSRPRTYPKVGVSGEVMDGPKSGATIGELVRASLERMNEQARELKEKLAETLTSTLNNTNDNETDIPEYWVTGIKVDESGRKKYKTYYHCHVCGDKGRHYLYEGTGTCKCWKCGAEMPVSQATEKYLEQDQYGNYFVAGTLANPKEAENVERDVLEAAVQTE